MRTPLPSWIAVLVAVTLLTQGCAATMRDTRAGDRPRTADPAVLADYVQRLPPGTGVRIERTTGRTLRGTLMKATHDAIVVQLRTRLPEPPVEIPLAEVFSVTPDSGNGGTIGKAIAAGVAAGAGAALVTFFVLIAIFSD
jgi:hypothetical protein